MATSKKNTFLLLTVLSITGLIGCASTRQIAFVNPVNTLTKHVSASTPSKKEFSERTEQVLRALGTEKEARKDTGGVLDHLVEQGKMRPDPHLTFAVAELSLMEAQRLEFKDGDTAQDRYLTSILAAHDYLFAPHFQSHRNAYDPHFRQACQIYNESLESLLRLQGNRLNVELRPDTVYSIRRSDGRDFRIRYVRSPTDRNSAELEPFKFASDYSVKGLRQEFRQHGLGVPLLGKGKPASKPTRETKYTPATLTFPMTAMLHIVPPGWAGMDGTDAVLELHDPLKTSEIAFAGQWVPLEADLTTPIAYTLSDPRMSQLHTFGLVRSDLLSKPVGKLLEETPSLKKRISDEELAWIESRKDGDDELKRTTIQGLYLMQPYEEGKIPVVFVHGLWSSPMTWMEMFNALRADPELRARYQFLFYFYPTGQPFWISAAELRRDMAEFRRTFDPGRNNPAFDRIVMVGHSMGGLISHLQTISSGMDFWKLVSDESPEVVFSKYKSAGVSVEEMNRWFFFEANPSVRCVVSIATPFQGSRASNHASQRLTQRMIKLPGNVTDATTAFVRGEDRSIKSNSLLRVKTSVESLAPDNPIFELMREKYRSSSVRYFNIAAVLEPSTPVGKFAAKSDGVVALDSARLDRCERETVIDSSHTKVHTHPQSILEVRRILQDHLRGTASIVTK